MIHFNLEEMPDNILEQLLKALDEEIAKLRDDRLLVIAEQNRRRYGDQMFLDV